MNNVTSTTRNYHWPKSMVTTSEIIRTRLMVDDNCINCKHSKGERTLNSKEIMVILFRTACSMDSRLLCIIGWETKKKLNPLNQWMSSHVRILISVSEWVWLLSSFDDSPIGYNKCLVFQMTKNGTRFIKAHIEKRILARSENRFHRNYVGDNQWKWFQSSVYLYHMAILTLASIRFVVLWLQNKRSNLFSSGLRTIWIGSIIMVFIFRENCNNGFKDSDFPLLKPIQLNIWYWSIYRLEDWIGVKMFH